MFISGQCTSTNTHETCSQHTLNMHIHNSNIRICIILQLFTNLPEYTTLYEVCSNIFNRAKPANNHIRRLHKHICIHLGIEEDSQTILADLPYSPSWTLFFGHPYHSPFHLCLLPGSLLPFRWAQDSPASPSCSSWVRGLWYSCSPKLPGYFASSQPLHWEAT